MTTYEVIGNIQKGNKCFYVPVRLKFDDGQETTYNYKCTRKKDLVADLADGRKLQQEALAAKLEDGYLVFNWTIGAKGLQPGFNTI